MWYLAYCNPHHIAHFAHSSIYFPCHDSGLMSTGPCSSVTHNDILYMIALAHDWLLHRRTQYRAPRGGAKRE